MIDWNLDLNDPEQYEIHRQNMIKSGLWVDSSRGSRLWWGQCLRDHTI